MAETKHTPGPWSTTTRQGSWDWVVYQVADRNIEICQPFHDGTDDNETGEANAHLIAAAPDMLAALSAAAGYLLNAKIDLETSAPRKTAISTIDGGLRVVRTAIAKAQREMIV